MAIQRARREVWLQKSAHTNIIIMIIRITILGACEKAKAGKGKERGKVKQLAWCINTPPCHFLPVDSNTSNYLHPSLTFLDSCNLASLSSSWVPITLAAVAPLASALPDNASAPNKLNAMA